MKLLLIQPCLLPGAGSSITAQALLEGLVEQGHDISYIALRSTDVSMLDHLRAKNVKAETFDKQSNILLTIKLFRRVYSFKPDVIYGFGVTCNLIACIAGRMVGAKIISSYRGMPVVVRKRKKLLIPFINRFSDAVIAVSEAIKSQLVCSFATPENKVHVVPPPIDHPHYENFSSREPEKLYFVGRLHHDKGTDLLIKAMKHLPERFVLDIVGDGPQKQELESLAEMLSLRQRVSFIGYKKNIIPLLYEKAGLLVVPSRTEGLGRVILEAFAAGVPVVATRTGGIEELVYDRESGYLISGLLNPGKIATAILRAAEDKQERCNIINSGLHILAKYSKPQIIKQTEAVMNSLFPAGNNSKAKHD